MTKQEFIASLTEKDIMSVYSGVNGKCCCGCSGKHTYNPLYKELGGENRGYALDDEDCNARTVKTILNKIKKNASLMNQGDYQPGDFVSVVLHKGGGKFNGRLYVAYLVPSDEDIAATRKRRAETKKEQAEAKVAALQGAGI